MKKSTEKKFGVKYLLHNFLYFVPNHLRNFTVGMAPKFNMNCMNSIKSFQTLDNYNSQIRLNYNSILSHHSYILNVVRTSRLRVVYNNNVFRIIVPFNMYLSQENALVQNIQRSMDYISYHLSRLNTLMGDHALASDYLVADGYTGDLTGDVPLINQARSLYRTLMGSFTHVSQETLQNLDLRSSLVNSLINNIDRYRYLVNSTQNYLRTYSIGWHQDFAGSVQLSFPGNTPLNTEQATSHVQDVDLEVNSLTETISNLISELNEVETNVLGLEVSEMKVHEYISAAAEIQST